MKLTIIVIRVKEIGEQSDRKESRSDKESKLILRN